MRYRIYKRVDGQFELHYRHWFLFWSSWQHEWTFLSLEQAQEAIHKARGAASKIIVDEGVL